MNPMRWTLVDDPGSFGLRPFTWLRPASGLLLGTETLAARWRRLVAPDPLEVACRRSLVPFEKGRVDWRAAASKGGSPQGTEIWVSDRVLPDLGLLDVLRSLGQDEVLRDLSGAWVGCRLGPRTQAVLGRAAATPAGPMPESGLAAAFDEMTRLGGPSAEVRVLRNPADLVVHQETLLADDLDRWLREVPGSGETGDGDAYETGSIRLADGCTVDRGAVLDARGGPIVLGPGCQVAPHTWLQGPLYAARDCRFLGGRIGGGTSLGPVCRVRGEVEATIFLGFANKAHDGFVGHSVLGEWVNLGALTTTSDLKNNYSSVVLEVDGQRENTGVRKVGVFFGDHVKTRIGCLLTCGTVVGVGANLIGDPAVSRKWIPDFSWGDGSEAGEYEINKFLRTAETVLERRKVPWTPAVETALREVFEATRAVRRAKPGSRETAEPTP